MSLAALIGLQGQVKRKKSIIELLVTKLIVVTHTVQYCSSTFDYFVLIVDYRTADIFVQQNISLRQLICSLSLTVIYMYMLQVDCNIEHTYTHLIKS